MEQTDNRIDIYPSVWRVAGMILSASLCAAACYFMTTIIPENGSTKDIITKYVGYIGLAFFSLAVIAQISWIISSAMRLPLARIYDDRLEYLIPARMKYKVIPFINVEAFAISVLGEKEKFTPKFIRVDYIDWYSKQTGISNTLVSLDNVNEILNDRLNKFWEQTMLTQPLNRASATKYLTSIGVERWRYDFDTTSRPDCIVVMRDGDRYNLVYVDERGDSKTLSNHLTENDACHALIENFTDKDAFKSKYGMN